MTIPANRVAAIVGVLTGLAAFVSALAGVLPHSWQNTSLAIVGALTVAAHNLHFMSGSQKDDANQAHERASALYNIASGQDVPGATEGVKADGFIPPGDAPTQAVPAPPPVA
jgi:hypothetical protein